MSTQKKGAPGRPKADNKLGIQIQTRVDQATFEALEAVAAKLERPSAWVLRKALEEYIDRNRST